MMVTVDAVLIINLVFEAYPNRKTPLFSVPKVSLSPRDDLVSEKWKNPLTLSRKVVLL